MNPKNKLKNFSSSDEQQIDKVVELIREYYDTHYAWPELGTEFVESLPITNDQIWIAVASYKILVNMPAGQSAYLSV